MLVERWGRREVTRMIVAPHELEAEFFAVDAEVGDSV